MPNRRRPLELTEIDLALLQGLADGKSIGDLAGEIGESQWALRYRITRIRYLIPSKNLVNVVVEAVRKGYID